MKHKVLLLLLVLVCLFSLLSFSSFAVDKYFEDPDILYFDDEYEYYAAIEENEDPDKIFQLNPGSDSLFSGLHLFTDNLTSPNYNWFNSRRLPYSDFPNYIQDILYNLSSTYSDDDVTSTSKRVPFVCCTVFSSSVTVYVGVNCAFGGLYLQSSDLSAQLQSVGILYQANPFSTYAASSSVLYMAKFDRNFSLTYDWTEVTPDNTYTFNSKTSKYKRVFSAGSTTAADFYFYGNNCLKLVSLESLTGNVSSNLFFSFRTNSRNDFSSYASRYCDDYRYSTSFRPLTLSEVSEAEAENTRKGILETIRELPSRLIDLIKGLFVPDEDELNEILGDFQETCSQHLGIVYESGFFIRQFFQTILNFNPAEDGYELTFPRIYGVDFDTEGEMSELFITETQTFSLSDIVSESPWSTLYSAYQTLVWVVFLLALIRLASKKFNSIIGGGSVNDS